jgi:predicted heme/steroid binding protein/uncharacterized membrane protein
MGQMTKDELHQYDGKEGNKAYVAFEGKIYDLTGSKLWKNGVHLKTHHAGHDLTVAMKAAPHGPQVMERYEAVAELVEEKAVEAAKPALKTPGKLATMILDRHPHPILVHFPIALSISAAFLSILSLYISNHVLEKAAFYNMIFAAVTTPVSIFTGVLSWYYNYSGIWTHIYRMKTLLSIVLVVLFAAALIVHFGFLTSGENVGFWYWLYTISVLFMAPTVMGLGYYGGKITFPS